MIKELDVLSNITVLQTTLHVQKNNFTQATLRSKILNAFLTQKKEFDILLTSHLFKRLKLKERICSRTRFL